MRQRASIILAGGGSKRMGSAKALLPLVDGRSQTMIWHLAHCALAFSDQLVVVTQRHDLRRIREETERVPASVLVTTDVEPFVGKGPLAGLYSGMKACRADDYFVLGCDFPYMTSAYVQQLREVVLNRPGAAAYVPEYENQLQPYAGVFREMKTKLYTLLSHDKLRWRDLHAVLSHVEIVPQHTWTQWTPKDTLWNMNTKAQYEAYMRKERDK